MCLQNDFTSEDFAHMKAPLVYEMFKSKTRYPLHAAIRLLREDVVFLFLIERSPPRAPPSMTYQGARRRPIWPIA